MQDILFWVRHRCHPPLSAHGLILLDAQMMSPLAPQSLLWQHRAQQSQCKAAKLLNLQAQQIMELQNLQPLCLITIKAMQRAKTQMLCQHRLLWSLPPAQYKQLGLLQRKLLWGQQAALCMLSPVAQLKHRQHSTSSRSASMQPCTCSFQAASGASQE